MTHGEIDYATSQEIAARFPEIPGEQFQKSVVFIDSDDNIIVSSDPDHLISTIGVSDMIIVHTKDATMVCPKREAQRVKELVGKVKEKFGTKFD